jgi:hypothetical protein
VILALGLQAFLLLTLFSLQLFFLAFPPLSL